MKAPGPRSWGRERKLWGGSPLPLPSKRSEKARPEGLGQEMGMFPSSDEAAGEKQGCLVGRCGRGQT